jgi:hypothetical protein
MSTSIVTRQSRLSDWNENAANNLLHPEQACFSVLPRTREMQALFFSSGILVSPLFFLTDLLLPPNYLFSCLPQ